ncbi:MAG: hypothetical protein U5R31_17415 [Acidimicrobiia bacterium]|nr:hypothetical protein [Acidimicrobiia bacterium]
MGTGPRRLEFATDEVEAIVPHLLTADRVAGRGWINLDPMVDADDMPEPSSGLTALFSAHGPPVPHLTWVAPTRGKRGGGDPASVGVEHGLGSKALPHLVEGGHPPPAGWRRLSDNPRRGLVLAVPEDAEPEATLRWMLDAAVALSRTPLTGSWQASVYER